MARWPSIPPTSKKPPRRCTGARHWMTFRPLPRDGSIVYVSYGVNTGAHMLRRLLTGLAVLSVCGCALSPREACENIIFPEQRSIDYLDPAQLPSAHIPDNVSPRTVTNSRPE